MAQKKDVEVKEQSEKRPVPQVLLSEDQRRIAALVENAKKDAPLIENIRELKQRVTMPIPAVIREKRPENTYRWKDKKDIDSELGVFGGLWEIVTKTNHSFLDARMFGAHGAITYKEQNILCFMRRTVSDMMTKDNLQTFNLRAEASINKTAQRFNAASGAGAAIVERVDDPGGSPSDMVLDSYKDF